MAASVETPEVLVLVDAADGLYLIGRRFFSQAARSADEPSPDEPALRAIGLLDPAFPIASLGIRTVLGVPAPVFAEPGIMDDGAAVAALALDGTYALLSRTMLDNIRIRPSDRARVRAALVPAGQPG